MTNLLRITVSDFVADVAGPMLLTLLPPCVSVCGDRLLLFCIVFAYVWVLVAALIGFSIAHVILLNGFVLIASWFHELQMITNQGNCIGLFYRSGRRVHMFAQHVQKTKEEPLGD